ncbi:MAG: hypothetical protein LBB61_09070 [Treponema sp.]|jgi:hypothetical protein|nr:hypothetical protein [Treponema sp.]
MKGVIVQVGEPKSIVLYNNGKIRAIPTPEGCHVGMVVTVKLNNKLKIIGITIAAVLLAAAGVIIGLSAAKGKAASPPPASAIEGDGTYGWQRGQEKMREIERDFPVH